MLTRWLAGSYYLFLGWSVLGNIWVGILGISPREKTFLQAYFLAVSYGTVNLES